MSLPENTALKTTGGRPRRHLLGRVLPSALVHRLPAGLVHEYLDPPRGTRQRVLTVLARVPDAEVPQLRRDLARIRGAASPFLDVPGTHFARLAVMASDDFRPQAAPDRDRMTRLDKLLDLVMHGGRPQEEDPPETSYLLFTASYDGLGESAGADQAEYAERLRTGLGEHADRIWRLCEDYPGRGDAAAFAAFIDAHTLRSGYVFSASDSEPSVDEVRDALELRRRIADLAVATDGMDDADLAARLRAEWEKPPSMAVHIAEPADAGPEVPLGLEMVSQLDGELADLADLTPNDLCLPTLPASAVGTADRVSTPPGAVPLSYPGPRHRPGPEVERIGGGVPPIDPDLTDVQNLVSSGYPRHSAARHLMLRVTDAAAARAWLRPVIDEIPTAGWAEHLVDKLGRDVEGADSGRPTPDRPSSPTFAAHVAVSYSGLSELGLPTEELTGFPVEFTAGMAAREAGLIPGTGTRPWRGPYAGDAKPHLLLMLSAPDQATLDAELADRPGLLPGPDSGLVIVDDIDAGRISDAPSPDGARAAGFREHFGFVDGLSQPRVHGVTTGRHTAELPPGEALLGYQDVDGDTAGSGVAASVGRNGSYLVWRKLEQDVAGFEELTRDLAGNLAGKVPTGTDAVELAAAKLMGRWRDGTPITLSTDGPRQSMIKQPFTFQAADAEGHGCPVGAHVRRANPRDSRPVEPNPEHTQGRNDGLEGTLALRHRMLRRGIPYGKPVSAGTWAGAEAPAGDPDEERGLLFVALVGDIHRQFEFIQAHWMSDGNAFRLGTDRDVISGAAPDGCKFVVQGHPNPSFVEQPRQIVTCRGGEYFLLPGISALRRIAAD
ncbi:hypothetical protein KIH74_01645 [Kineosporia sp. J2-2]|uniref:Dyp-type peroxidase family n=1 Tax=Kineosporia corallincola TaxID=2835133 RepID=A0ABS5TBV7_9ACTN|nr:hypothetical protein [Kineosporia corallincola]MBT0767608.1 hypothetical protein [Kineosporia corallincola]